jgi:hypothetical protein
MIVRGWFRKKIKLKYIVVIYPVFIYVCTFSVLLFLYIPFTFFVFHICLSLITFTCQSAQCLRVISPYFHSCVYIKAIPLSIYIHLEYCKIRLCLFPLPCTLPCLRKVDCQWPLWYCPPFNDVSCTHMFLAYGAFPCHHLCIKRCPAFVNTFNHSHESSPFWLELNPAMFTNKRLVQLAKPVLRQCVARQFVATTNCCPP